MHAEKTMIDQFGVEVLSGRVPYADGSESEVLKVLSAASDVSSGSDELAAAIKDWPTRYHFSRLRRNIIAPLRLNSSSRVLEVGCGTGPILRAIGETGATAVGVEGNLERARSARERCRDLPNVKVSCGTLDDIDKTEAFDLVLLVGVLEYSAAMTESGGGALGLLQRAAARLSPDGAVVIAIENQLGLKYLLGYPEDHLGAPWVGLRGYEPDGIRTWSRSGLSTLIASAGLTNQRWLYAYPDYKLPTLLIDDALLARDDSHELVRKLVRVPVRDLTASSAQIVDEHRALAVMSEAGLVGETANSFLVVATKEAATPQAHLHEAIAYLHSDERARLWIRARRLVADDGGLMLINAAGSNTTSQIGWLQQRTPNEELFHPGDNLEDLIIDSFAGRDVAGATALLGLWRGQLEAAASHSSAERATTSPWVDGETEVTLPGDALDLTPRNIVVADSHVQVVDREWVIDGGCDLDLVAYRACWHLANELLRRYVPGAWASTSSVAEVAEHLLRIADFRLRAKVRDRWLVAEGELQALVAASDAAEMVHQYGVMSAARPVLEPRAIPLAEIRTLLDENSRLREELVHRRSEIDALAAHAEESRVAVEATRVASDLADAELRTCAEQVERLERQVERLEADLAIRPDPADHEGLLAELARVGNEVAQMRLSETWRVGSMLTLPFRAARRLRRSAG